MKKKNLLFLSFAATLLTFAVSCTDDDNANNGSENGRMSIRFDISEVQQPVTGDDTETKKQSPGRADMPLLTAEDLTPRTLKAESDINGFSPCFEETTIEGVNPIKQTDTPRSRAAIKTVIDADFSLHGCKGGTPVSYVFHNEQVRSDGTLYNTQFWNASDPTRRFYAFYPYAGSAESGMQLSTSSETGEPWVDFTVNADVMKQKDLMFAKTSDITYNGSGTAPNVPLAFTHTLTAVKFAVGNNLSYNWVIKKIEILNACSKGRYTIGSGWGNQSTPATFTLDNLNFNTSAAINSAITNNDQTFLMLPQQLTGKGVKVRITFSDGKTVTTTLKGEWKPNTTKTYTLSNNLSSNWEWKIFASGSNALNYNETSSPYTITSYRQQAGNTQQQAVPWEVVGYDADGNGTFSMDEKPAWLTSLSKMNGNGGTAADAGTASIDANSYIEDFKAQREATIKNATPRGVANYPWDLSTHDIKGNTTSRNTANCYVISAPGYYKLPLIYGNAIKNGITNTGSVYTSNTSTTTNPILKTFKDHNGADISSPYISQTNNRANRPSHAEIVWTDIDGLTSQNLSLSVYGANTIYDATDDYLTFHMPQSSINQGNVVVAVKNSANTVLWSWHLWFAPDDVLDVTECTNYQGKTYKFTKENLGQKYTEWKKTTYESPRSVVVKVKQTIGNAEATFVITQNPYHERKAINTLYQEGRKDAFSVENRAGISIGGNNMSITNGIQNPGVVYTYGSSWHDENYGYRYYNLWSMDNTTTGYNDNPVRKTIYDPNPAGFSMCASNAFTGFTRNGQNGGPINNTGVWTTGYTFNNKISNPTATLFFPASGCRTGEQGTPDTQYMWKVGYYWTAMPLTFDEAPQFLLSREDGVHPCHRNGRSHGFSVRPVAETN
ncbi:MAG: fimbrillin family protein [Prevotella sp.]|nr:fimbrillin family protein [Prevotella sp.]